MTVLLLALIITGTLGYHFLEGWTLFESLYMTVITITTTGYGEIREMSTYGRTLSMLLMFFGVGIFLYSVNLFVSAVFENASRRWEKMVEKMKDHYILCGYGNMGKEIARELPSENTAVIDIELNKVESARAEGFPSLHGDATDEMILEKAGVKRAKAIICCMSDAANAFAILTAKELNPSIKALAILRNPEAERKLLRVGVDVLLSPYRDTAKKVRGIIFEEPMTEFIERIMSGKKSLYLEKFVVEDERISGRTLRELDLRRKMGCTVLAIIRGGNILVPDADTKIEKGDIMYMLCREPVEFEKRMKL